ncbi:GSCOCG00008928001-RA-CDS [Cotesia congregata]|nr:GSCOCG00008928001-RA-CDS [Cotesia congregata]
MSGRNNEDDDENFAVFGEALEELEEDTLRKKKPVTVEDQYALDDQGRRRFHGAFTGGFSAGYFNSVGTRDGWRPQQFKSSRSSKAENVSQRPEDFMDEEDTGEFGIAPTGIRATGDFSDRSERAKKRKRDQTDGSQPIPGEPVLKELLKPVTYTMGVILLKKMGWKPGQGVGPRLAKKDKKKIHERNTKKKVYGCTLPGQEITPYESNSESSDNDEEILFAPDDYELFRCNPKENYFGIGYSGLERQSVLSNNFNLFDTTTFTMQDKNKKLSIRGQAFGVGVFEADDEDIYSSTDMSNYDFSLGPESKKNQRTNEKKDNASKDNCIEGFVAAKNCLSRKKIFDPPLLPRDYKPVHKIKKKSRFSSIVPDEQDKEKSCFKQKLNADERLQILDEKPSSEKSDDQSKLPTQNEDLKIQGIDTKEIKKSKLSWMDKLNSSIFLSGGIVGSNKKSTDTFENLEAKKILSNEVSSEEIKIDFNKVDESSAFRKSEEESINKINNSSNETKEFVSKSVNNTLSSVPEDQMIKAAKMNMFGKLTRTIDVWQPASVVCKQLNIPEPFGKSMKAEPQKRKRYSVFESLNNYNEDKYQKATDTAGTFKEPVIMDKSFEKKNLNLLEENNLNLDLNVDKSQDNSFKIDNKKDTFNLNSTNLATTSVNSLKSSNRHESDKADESQASSLVGEQLGKVEANKDLFKAIFLSSSDESEAEDDPEDVDNNTVKSLLIGKPATELINVQRNNSPPRGIFAKLDLDDLMKSKKIVEKINESKVKESTIIPCKDEEIQVIGKESLSSNTVTESEDLLNSYGPVLPQHPTKVKDTSDSGEIQKPVYNKKIVSKLDNVELSLKWVEKTKSKKAKKDKKKSKHKAKEKKRKHQKKER